LKLTGEKKMTYSSRIKYNRKKRVQKIKNALGIAFITVSVGFFATAMALDFSLRAAHGYNAYKASQALSLS
jgi:hypothetical protein